VETDLDEGSVVQDLAAVEDEGRLLHRRVDPTEIQTPKKCEPNLVLNLFTKDEKIKSEQNRTFTVFLNMNGKNVFPNLHYENKKHFLLLWKNALAH
jgi:hypothetical protein